VRPQRWLRFRLGARGGRLLRWHPGRRMDQHGMHHGADAQCGKRRLQRRMCTFVRPSPLLTLDFVLARSAAHPSFLPEVIIYDGEKAAGEGCCLD
jgi:hypothetical protein